MAMVTMETHRQYAMMLYTCVLLPLGRDERDGARHVGTAVHGQQNGQPSLEAEGRGVSCIVWYRITAEISLICTFSVLWLSTSSSRVAKVSSESVPPSSPCRGLHSDTLPFPYWMILECRPTELR